MKKKAALLFLSCLLATTLLLGSCAKSTSTSASTSTSTLTSTSTSASTSTSTSTSTPAMTSTTVGNWWDKLGKPQYGGTMTIRITSNITNFDPASANMGGQVNINCAWMEKLYCDDWTLDPAVFAYNVDFRPSEYLKGNLAESWEFTDPVTYVVHLRHGIHWQNIPPTNGREFVADDVVFHYDRLFGLGYGFTKAFGNRITDPEAIYLTSVTATDNYTVVFKWKTSNAEFILETVHALGATTDLTARDAVQQWGDLNDWHHAVGTGPFILSDFVSGSSAILVRNPNYWAYDERYPQNKLPYIDTLKILIVPDQSTALSGLRTGKIDVLDQIPSSQAQATQKTNPEILEVTTPAATSESVVPRNDKVPFTDIRVREALQMAIDLPTIAKTYYGGTTEPYPSSVTSRYVKGWGLPYEEWPQDLKDQYAYNPTAAKQLLAAAGYPTGFNTDVVVDSSGDTNLIQIVQSYFSAIGVNMQIVQMDGSLFGPYVRVNYKHDQMASQLAGSPLGFTYEPIRQLQRFTTGKGGNYAMTADPVYDAFFTNAMAATSVDQVKQIVRDANEYAARQHFAISLLQPMIFTLYQPWLKGYNGQSRSITGAGGTLFLISFYASRFWIDQNLKASLVH